ncbi:23S rRNA (adenine(1618)-N(6))-methyltransferase RlmF [Kordia zhangzhouensis]|uniref:23S rRNA (adenine(1618)-N(6))-methyltransferase RlmF n=1 Tax=Kordia zhangzhouensis TaxID=1620405 RepID=UPI00062966C9|nr:23S rRNA (adenine(1618)-N(6))-methyltransferase RlmF [Kordia zhangzhouensis]
MNSSKEQKVSLHPRNKHQGQYDFGVLTNACPELKLFVNINEFGTETINFFNPKAVLLLNKALLKAYYKIDFWEIPKHYLCPPIPGRADYIHHIASLLKETNLTQNVTCLDVGTGANLIYPIIGTHEYNWTFIASDIETVSLENATNIIENNSRLHNRVELRKQENPNFIFKEIIRPKEQITVTICNPPFHRSAKQAQEGTRRKLQNLQETHPLTLTLNFGGQHNELWCKGGEKKFIKNMIKESALFSKQCKWFTTLVSKKEHLPAFYEALKRVNAKTVKTIPMGQGNKLSRILAWSFQ